jgi:hypothetical protein
MKEDRIIRAVKKMLVESVNAIIGEFLFEIPLLEFGEDIKGNSVVVPEVRLVQCERNEKERIIEVDAYSVSVYFFVSQVEGERICYAYAQAVEEALKASPTLGGEVERAEIVQKVYKSPKYVNYGDGWELGITLRVTVER